MHPQVGEEVQLALGMMDDVKLPERADSVPDPVVKPLQEIENQERDQYLDPQGPLGQYRNYVPPGRAGIEQAEKPDERWECGGLEGQVQIEPEKVLQKTPGEHPLLPNGRPDPFEREDHGDPEVEPRAAVDLDRGPVVDLDLVGRDRAEPFVKTHRTTIASP